MKKCFVVALALGCAALQGASAQKWQVGAKTLTAQHGSGLSAYMGVMWHYMALYEKGDRNDRMVLRFGTEKAPAPGKYRIVSDPTKIGANDVCIEYGNNSALTATYLSEGAPELYATVARVNGKLVCTVPTVSAKQRDGEEKVTLSMVAMPLYDF